MTSTPPVSEAGARRERIVRLVRDRGHVVVAELASELGVSEMTVRRDVALLDSEQRVISFYGGVRAPGPEAVPGPFGLRATQESGPKALIAARAAELVRDGSVIAIDSGSTAALLAGHLTDRPGLKVVTASVPVVTALMDSRTVDVISLGGTLRQEMRSFIGSTAVAAAHDLQIETYFLAAAALSDRGAFDITNLDTPVKRALISVSTRVVALADSTKFGQRAISRTCGWDAIDALVTDDRIEPEWVDRLTNQGVDVIVASATG